MVEFIEMVSEVIELGCLFGGFAYEFVEKDAEIQWILLLLTCFNSLIVSG